jgi:hypothetical protein
MIFTPTGITTYNEAEKRLVEMPFDKYVDLVPPDAKFTKSELIEKLNKYKSELWDHGFAYTISECGTQIKKSKIIHDKAKKNDSKR